MSKLGNLGAYQMFKVNVKVKKILVVVSCQFLWLYFIS